MKHPAPQEPVVTDEMRALRAAIIGLPEALRDVFLLHGVAGLSYPEIAIHLGLETPAVQKMLAGALVELLQATRLANTHLNDGKPPTSIAMSRGKLRGGAGGRTRTGTPFETAF